MSSEESNLTPLHPSLLASSATNEEGKKVRTDAYKPELIKIFQLDRYEERSWTSPPVNAIRIYVDGSVRYQVQAACGGVIKNSDGHWLMGFCKSLGAHTVIEAELHAIMLGLKVGHRMGLHKILLYYDSLDAVNILMRDCCYADHPLKEIIRETRGLLYFDYLDVKLHYTPRDIISYADYMAKKGHNAPANEDVLLIPTIPAGCMEMAMRDQLVCGS